MLGLLRVEIVHTRHASVHAVVVHSMHKRVADHSRPKLLGFGQISIGAGGFGLAHATRAAPAAITTCRPAIVFDGVDSGRWGKGLCSHFPRATSEHLCMPVHSMRRHGQFIALWGERSAFTRHAKLALDAGVMRPEIL